MAFDIAKIQDSLNKYVIAPAAIFGLAGFAFDVEAESTTRLHAEVTDHYVEDNTVINDHMAIRPSEITFKSYVGELVYLEESKAENFIQDAIQKLTILSPLLPEISDSAKIIQNKYRNMNVMSLGEITGDTLNQFRDIYALVKNLNPANEKQRQAYLYFKALMEAKTIMSYQSPFEFMTDMVITDVLAVQSADSKYIADFSITMKKIRFAKIETTDYKPEDNQGRGASTRAPVQNRGNVQGSIISDPLLDSILWQSTTEGLSDFNVPLPDRPLFPNGAKLP